MVRLAVVPGNALDDLEEKGLAARLSDYFNPQGFFNAVVVVSPFEVAVREAFNLRVFPTKDVELPRRLRAFGADIVRAYGGGIPADMVTFYRAAGVVVVVSIHDKRPEMIRPSVGRADMVFVVSDELKAIAASLGVRPERILVVPNGVDGALMRRQEVSKGLAARFPFKYKLLHVGRKSPEKNIEALVRAMARLGPDYGLVAVGQGESAPYQELARQAGVAGRCVFLGGMAQAELVDYYNWADVVCHPSRAEAMCNVLLEALSCGRVVVASRAAATGLGAVAAGAMRLVADPEDDGRLAQEVRNICEDPVLAAGLRNGARKGVEHLFLEKTQAHEVACYRRVLELRAQGVFRRHFRDDAGLCMANIGRRLSLALRRLT